MLDNNVDIQKVDINFLKFELKMSSLAYIQLIKLLSILCSEYENHPEVIGFMKEKNFFVEKEKNFMIETIYLNNELLCKELLSYDDSMYIKKEIIINNNWHNLKDIVIHKSPKNQILFLNFNEDNKKNPSHLIKEIYYLKGNTIYIVDSGVNLFKLLRKIIN